MKNRETLLLLPVVLYAVSSIQLPNSCTLDQYYDSAMLTCQGCSANASLVRSSDGFSCICDERSIPSGPGTCKPCNVTEVVTSDGTACVPRKCQNVAGRVVCRKCPNDYISFTQNLDGSPMKEVQCIKCARGYKPQGDKCVRCESCVCARNQIVVKDICVPKAYVNERPTYTEKILHPLELLDIVKHEYLCTKNDTSMCQALANKCVHNFYTSDLGGPCRLWLQPKLSPKYLPPLVLPRDKNPGEMSLPRGKGVIHFAIAAYSSDGKMKFLDDPTTQPRDCNLPFTISIGHDYEIDCTINITKLTATDFNASLSAYIWADGDYEPLSVSIKKPNGYNVSRESWPSSWFTRYFVVHRSLSTTSNTTNVIYLRTLSIQLRVNRDSHANGSLRLQILIEAEYATTDLTGSVTTSLRVNHFLPNAGVIRGLEVWGGVIGAMLTLYALVQWRGVVRRGGLYYSILPILAGSIADTLYFASLLSTLHALAGEAGTLGITLPLSHPEEKIIRACLFSAVSCKALKIVWINWKQCTCDIIFLDWSEYNPPTVKDTSTNDDEKWKATTIAREWSLIQTMRRASPGFTITGALTILHLTTSWQSTLPKSQGYKWAMFSMVWWCSYGIVLLFTWIVERWFKSTTSPLLKICTKMNISLLVFQEEFYAHYIHGRNDDFKEVRSMAGPLTTCRVACVPQLRAVCKQLSAPETGILGEGEHRHALLSKFLAAFFERALDGLNWVASERTILERLLDVEVTTREAGGTSALLYDDNTTPSCFSMTWWGEEWALSTFDAMVISSILIASGDTLFAALITAIVWQVLKQIRAWLGNRNQILKTCVDIHFS